MVILWINPRNGFMKWIQLFYMVRILTPRAIFRFPPVLKNGCYTQTFIRVNGRWCWCVYLATSTVSLQHVVWVLRCPFLAEKHMPWTVCWCKFWVGVLFACKMLSHEYSWKSIFMLLNSGKHEQLIILQSTYMVTRSLYVSAKNRVKPCLNSYNNGGFNIKFYSSDGLYAFQFFLKFFDFFKN